MKALELISQVAECRSERWQNSDIPSGGERLLEVIADHYKTCEECRETFDLMEYDEETLIDLWHDFMAQTEDPADWICEEGLQALFDHPIDVFLVTIENSDPSKWSIATSEEGAKFALREKYPGVEFGDFEPCEEPDAVENEYVMYATVEGETVARIYTESEN
jgi:hypothetical protein